jgi:hypothetical protein
MFLCSLDDANNQVMLTHTCPGEMEADDLRPPDAFKLLSDALKDPELDAVASQVAIVIMLLVQLTRILALRLTYIG